MRIIRLRAVQPPTPGAPQDWRTQLGQVVVEVQTDDGLTGIGVGGGGAAGIHVIQTVLSDLLLGRDADNVEQLHREMCRQTSFYGRGGLVVMAISGVDLALWDLRAKRAETPIAKLLNPDVDLAARIPTYATVFDDVATRQAIDAGHAAVKLHVERFGNRPNPTDVADLVRRVRDAIGAGGMMMIDAFARWDVDSTLRVAQAVAEFDVRWIEEPVPPDRLDLYETLARECPVPIAGGEHEYLAAGFRELIDRRLHAFVQPDINWCGGLTTLIEIYKMAKQAGVIVCPHRGCEPYALHAIAALEPEPLAESPRTWFTSVDGFPQIENGAIQLRDEPGFGVSVSEIF